MNRSNRGYEFGDLNLGAPAIGPIENTNVSQAPEVLAQQARAVEEISAFAQKRANAEAQFNGRLQAVKDAKDGVFAQIDPNTLYGDAYVKTMQENYSAIAELDLRKGLSAAAIATETPEDFINEAQKVQSQVFGKLGETIQKNPDNPHWQTLYQNGQNLAQSLIDREVNARELARKEANVQAAQASMAEVANARILEATARARDAQITPNEQNTNNALATKKAAIDAIVKLGPKTEFELNGVKFAADNSRAGVWNPAKLQVEIKNTEAKIFQETQIAQIEQAKSGEAQLAFAKTFGENWRKRPPELAWLSDDKAQDIEDNLYRVANQTLGRESQELGLKKDDLKQLINMVQYGGRLDAKQVESGDALIAAIGEPDIAQMWNNAKEISKTGRRLLSGADITSTRGGAIPVGGYFGVPPSVHWGYSSGGSGGRRRGGYYIGRSRRGLSAHESEVLDAADRGFTSNPLQAAFSHGYQVPSLNTANLLNVKKENSQVLVQEIAQRFAFAQALSRETGAPIRAFTNREVAAVKARIASQPGYSIQLATQLRGLGEAARPVMAELGLQGTERIAVNMAAGGLPNHAIAGVVLGKNGANVNLSAPETAAFNRAREAYRMAARGNPAILGNFNAIEQAVKNRMLYDKSRGQEAGNPLQYFNDAFGARRIRGQVYGGYEVVNNSAVVVPDWLRRGAFREFLTDNAKNFANHVSYGNGEAVRPHRLQQMQLYFFPEQNGEFNYGFVAGWNRDGSPQLLKDRRTGRPYSFSMNAFYDYFRNRKPNWILR